MICIISGNYLEAKQYASAQHWSDSEWFYPTDVDELMQRNNFHVIVIGTAGQNVPPKYFEKVFQLAHQRGRIGR